MLGKLPAKFWVFLLNRVYTLSARVKAFVVYPSAMAREDCSERGLPSPEARRQILQHAGIVLDHARDLVYRLDLHETSFPRSGRENDLVLERTKKDDVFGGDADEATPPSNGQALAA